MKHLSIDVETRSSIDIQKAGAYKYVQSPDFQILLFAYKADDEPVKVVDLASGGKIPEEILLALTDDTVIKHAYNAVFEWLCLNRAWMETPITQWQCTMVWAMYCGYAAGLAAADHLEVGNRARTVVGPHPVRQQAEDAVHVQAARSSRTA